MSYDVRLTGVAKTYRRGSQDTEVLHGLNMEINRGEFVALMGPSGSGKTTILNMIAGLDKPTKGQVQVLGEDIGHFAESRLAAWRARNVGFVFQFYNLLPVLNAQANVELPLLLTKLTRSRKRDNSLSALRAVGLTDRATHKPGELSGGEQQRVAIARALVTDPALLVCDEPTGDLDRQSAKEILMLLKTLNNELGKTIVMVTHDPIAASYASRTLRVDKGRLLESDTQV